MLHDPAQPAAVDLASLEPDEAAGLRNDKIFQAYTRIVEAIELLTGLDDISPEPAQGDVPDGLESQAAPRQSSAFRTRVHVKQPPPPPERPAPQRPPDDLTAIRRIDRELAERLAALGVAHFETIANWDRVRVREVRDRLDLGKRIWRENWIEQAALLVLRADRTEAAGAGATADLAEEPLGIEQTEEAQAAPPHAGQIEASAEPEPETVAEEDLAAVDTEPPATPDGPVVATSEPEAPPTSHEQPPPISEQAPLPAHPAGTSAGNHTHKTGRRPKRLPPPSPRRFAYIKGISDEMAQALRVAGVTSFAEISKWTRADVMWFGALLGPKAHIPNDQWIEQATILADGRWTHHALRVVNGETRSLVAVPIPPEWRPPPLPKAIAPANEPRQGPPASPEPIAVVVEHTAATEPPVDAVHAGKAQDVTPEPTVEEPAFADRRSPAITIPVPPEPVSAAAEQLAAARTPFSLRNLRRPPPDLGMPWRQPADAPARPEQAEAMPAAAPVPEHSIAEPSDAAKQASDKPPRTLPTSEPQPLPQDDLHIAPPATDAPSAETSTDEDAFVLSAADDLDDSEFLVIRRADQAEPSPIPDQPAAEMPPATIEPAAPPAPDPIPLSFADGPGPADHWSTDDELEPTDTEAPMVWRDEAEVVIISQSRNDKTAGSEREWPEPATGDLQYAPRLLREPAPVTRGETVPFEGFSDFADEAEEATVTIIRAEASEEPASSILPQDPANDPAEPRPERPVERGARRIGARFLKALTGD